MVPARASAPAQARRVSAGKAKHPSLVDALRVPLARGDAATRLAAGRARPAVATALSEESGAVSASGVGGGLGGGRLLNGGLATTAVEQAGSGNAVAGEGGVEVEENAGVAGAVEGGGGRTAGARAAAAGDLNVNTLRVELRAIGVVGRVEGDDLVTENVLAGGNGRGDGDGPRVSVGDEVVGSPSSRVGARDEALLGNLGKAQGASVGVEGGEVVDDGALVGVWPGVPSQRHALAGGNLDKVGGGAGALVAGNVGRLSSVGLDESVVQVVGSPADRVAGNVAGDSAGVGDAVGDDLGDVAVAVNRRDGSQEAEEDGLGKHDCSCRRQGADADADADADIGRGQRTRGW
jgi:hypothetical protein